MKGEYQKGDRVQVVLRKRTGKIIHLNQYGEYVVVFRVLPMNYPFQDLGAFFPDSLDLISRKARR